MLGSIKHDKTSPQKYLTLSHKLEGDMFFRLFSMSVAQTNLYISF